MTLRTVGLIFIIVGIIALTYGGISYITHQEVVNIGPLELNVKYREFLALPPILGALALGVGILLVLGEIRKA